MITKEQEEKYTTALGYHCPYCESTDIQRGKLQEIYGLSIFKNCSCNSCMKKWTERWGLEAVLEFEEPESIPRKSNDN